MLLSLIGCVGVTLLITLGLAWPVVARSPVAPAEKLVASAGLSLVAVFVVAWTIYVFVLSFTLLWLLPVLALAGLWLGRNALREVWHDGLARALLVAQLVVTAWSLAWLATITSYSGGGWAADWFEHWERARFFIERWPLHYRFIDQYPLTARPPLANVVTGAFLQLSRIDFPHYQVVSTLLGSLVFLPAALFASRLSLPGGARSPSGPGFDQPSSSGNPGRLGEAAPPAILALAFMLNPMFVQNATFAWTKLPAAFLALAGLWFFVRALDPDAPRQDLLVWSGALLAAGVLAHFSVGPYVVALALLWAAVTFGRRPGGAWWRDSFGGVVAGTVVLAFWFMWAVRVYGPAGTFLSSTSATSAHVREGNQLAKIALNIVDTLVPHFLRPLDPALIAQRSTWGAWRDWFFQSYQVNLPLAIGSVAWLVALQEALRIRRDTAPPGYRFWAFFVVVTLLLGIAVHGARDHWGLAHICLQPLVLLALAFLASRWNELGRGWRVTLALGAAVDFVFGIALHFAVQSHLLDRWFGSEQGLGAIAGTYNEAALMNAGAKLVHGLVFFRDALGGLAVVAPVALLALLAFAIARVVRVQARG